MTTYAERVASVEAIQGAGLGLVALADADSEVITIKKPAPDNTCTNAEVLAHEPHTADHAEEVIA